MSRRWLGRSGWTAGLAGCALAVGVGVPAATGMTSPHTAAPAAAVPAAASAGPGPGQISYDRILAWFALLYREKRTGYDGRLGVSLDGYDPGLNVATAFLDITGIPPRLFPRDEVINLRELRRHRPDLARQLRQSPRMTRIWALSRFSAGKAVLSRLRTLVGKHGEPDGRLPPSLRHAGPGLFRAIEVAGRRLHREGFLGRPDALVGRLVDVFSERSLCLRCDPYVRKRLTTSGVLDTVRLRSMVAAGGTGAGSSQSAARELRSLLEEQAPQALVASLRKRGGGPALPPPPDAGPSRSTPRPMSVDNLAAMLSRPHGQGPGGIDFSSLELRYLSEAPTGDGSDLGFAFRARGPAGRGSGTVTDGLHNAAQASNAFLVWLALPPQTFWVDLRPDRPNRVVSAALGRTDTGRVLLGADLALMRTEARLMDPRTRLGKRYWRRLRPMPDGSYCLTYRTRIVPGTAKVRDTGDAIYVADASLDVRVDRPDTVGARCGRGTATADRHNAAVYRRLILPRVKQQLNHAPRFQALRRVYLSRVVADWYRQRSSTTQTAYDDLIDSGDVERWRRTGPWRPKQTYRSYLKAVGRDGFTRRTRRMHGHRTVIRTYRTGGVDFTSLSQQDLAGPALGSRWPGLVRTVQQSLRQVAIAPRTDARWVGGTTRVAAPVPAQPAGRVGISEPDRPTAPPSGDDPWSRRYAPYAVPAMLLLGVGLIGIAVARERRRQRGSWGWR